MIVVDASAAIEMLLRSPKGAVVEERLLAGDETLHAPHLIDLEVLQVLRRYVRRGDMSAERAGEALDDLRALPLNRYPHEPLTDRIWELRDNLSAYDAAYLALAEALQAGLLTCDAALVGAAGLDVRVELL